MIWIFLLKYFTTLRFVHIGSNVYNNVLDTGKYLHVLLFIIIVSIPRATDVGRRRAVRVRTTYNAIIVHKLVKSFIPAIVASFMKKITRWLPLSLLHFLRHPTISIFFSTAPLPIHCFLLLSYILYIQPFLNWVTIFYRARRWQVVHVKKINHLKPHKLLKIW